MNSERNDRGSAIGNVDTYVAFRPAQQYTKVGPANQRQDQKK